jgi:anaphase-promoting complex subunit 4
MWDGQLNISSVQVIRLGFLIENGISRAQNVDTALVQVGDGRIKDMKFMDDKVLLILWDSNGHSFQDLSICAKSDYEAGTRSLLSLFYDIIPIGLGASHMKYSSYMQDGGSYIPTVFSNDEVKSQLSKHQMSSLGSFLPERMDVRERSRRREKGNTRRIVLLGDDKRQYKVFKLADAATGADGDIPMS